MDIFDLQDEINQQIAALIQPEIERTERQRIVTKPPNDLAAWEYCLQGHAYMYELTKEGNEKAREMYSRAVERDPHYARGYTGLAWTYANDMRFFNAPDQLAY